MRSVVSLLLLAIVPSLCYPAEPVPGDGPISMMMVKVDGEKLLSQVNSKVTKYIVIVGSDSKKKTIEIEEDVSTITFHDLKKIRATNNDDREISPDVLANRLKVTTPVFFLQQPLSADVKAKFKKKLTLFLMILGFMPMTMNQMKIKNRWDYDIVFSNSFLQFTYNK